jgi:hypothetical protein
MSHDDLTMEELIHEQASLLHLKQNVNILAANLDALFTKSSNKDVLSEKGALPFALPV